MSAHCVGGALGSYFPGFLYRKFGWMAFILFICALLSALMVLSLILCGAAVQSAADDLHEQMHDVAKHR